MSEALTAMAWKLPLPPAKKLVFLAICRTSNAEGECTRSIPEISALCSMDERTVQRAIIWLVGEGIVSRQARPGTSTLHRVHPRQPATPTPGSLPPPPPAECHPRQPATPGSLPPPAPAECHPTPGTVPPRFPSPLNNPPSSLPRTEEKKRARGNGDLMTLRVYVARCKADGAKSIPGDHAVFGYASQIRLPTDLLKLCWLEFESRYLSREKRYKDWPAVFHNAVRANWFKLWYQDQAGEWCLTVAGKQAKALHAERLKG